MNMVTIPIQIQRMCYNIKQINAESLRAKGEPDDKNYNFRYWKCIDEI